MIDDKILTIREVAALLKIGDKTAYTMAQSGELPCFKVRGQWRFRRCDINSWIHDRIGKPASSHAAIDDTVEVDDDAQ